MASKGYLEKKRRETDERIAKEQAQTNKRGQDLKLVSDLYSGSVKGIASIFKGASNDPKWNTTYLEGKDSTFTNISTFERAGIPNSCLTLTSYNTWLTNLDTGAVSIIDLSISATPGIVSINYWPTLGSNDPTVAPGTSGTTYERFPVNASLARTKAELRQYNSRMAGYPTDVLGMYLIQSVDIAAALADANTVLSLYLTYDANNRYAPCDLVYAKGYDYNDIKDHIAQYRARYETLAAKFNKNIVTPKDLPLLQRRVWMAAAVYKDAHLRMGQYYVFHRNGWYLMTEDEDVLGVVNTTSMNTKLSVLFDTIDTAMERITNSATFGDLEADMRAAIPPANRYLADEMVCKTPMIIDVNDEVLNEIHNIITLPEGVRTSSDFRITTDGTYLESHYVWKVLSNLSASAQEEYAIISPAMNSDSGIVTPGLSVSGTNPLGFNDSHIYLDNYTDKQDSDMLWISTRWRLLQFGYTQGSSGNHQYAHKIMSCGTEVISHFTVFVFEPGSDYASTFNMHSYDFDINRCAYISSFDWAPFIKFFNVDIPDPEGSPNLRNVIVSKVGDNGNYYSVSRENLHQLNELSNLSMYFLPTKEFKPVR